MILTIEAQEWVRWVSPNIRIIAGNTVTCVVNVDSMIADDLLEAIRGLPNLIDAKVVKL